MAMDEEGTSKIQVDTVFESQKYLFTCDGIKIYIEDEHSNQSVLKSSTFNHTHERVHERIKNRNWYDMTMEEAINNSTSGMIQFAHPNKKKKAK
eukprot:7408293-Ditylum_brightwellii.AAC.1